MLLCAYNGYAFDFRVLLYHLYRYGIEIPADMLLIDPMYEIIHADGYYLKFDEEF